MSALRGRSSTSTRFHPRLEIAITPKRQTPRAHRKPRCTTPERRDNIIDKAVETVVDVPDHGDALSPDREETINNKVQVYQVRSLDRPLFIVFAQNSEGIVVTSQTREQGMMERAVSSSLFFVYVIKKRVH